MSSTAPTPRPGDQLASAVCTTRVVVVRAPADRQPVITCGGTPMVPAASAKPTTPCDTTVTTLIGKRYVDAADSFEVLCTSSGAGELGCDGVAMFVKAAMPLPASD